MSKTDQTPAARRIPAANVAASSMKPCTAGSWSWSWLRARHLDETTLAEQFRMSRAPVREALTRLASENLVVMAPNRTTIVAPLDLTDFPRYAEALDLMQRANSRLAAQRRTEADVAALRRLANAFDALLDRYNPMEMSAANKAFHMAIAEAGGKPVSDPYLSRVVGRRPTLVALAVSLPAGDGNSDCHKRRIII